MVYTKPKLNDNSVSHCQDCDLTQSSAWHGHDHFLPLCAITLFLTKWWPDCLFNQALQFHYNAYILIIPKSLLDQHFSVSSELMQYLGRCLVLTGILSRVALLRSLLLIILGTTPVLLVSWTSTRSRTWNKYTFTDRLNLFN